MNGDLVPPRLIHSLMFRPDGLVEVSCADDSDEGERAALLRTYVFDSDVFAEELESLKSDISDLVDEVAIYLRNPDARSERMAKLPVPRNDDGPAPTQDFDASEF